VEHLKDAGLDIVDVGSDSAEIVRYPCYAAKVAGAVSRGRCPAAF
jgi:ribose 5-phosphate isomerase B